MTPRAKDTNVAVFDSSPLIFLARIDLLREATALHSESILPESVGKEVVDVGRRIGAPETAGIETLLDEKRLTVVAAARTALSRRLESNRGLSTADRDSIALAVERDARLLADDSAVRAAARHLDIPLGGTLSCLFALVKNGGIDAEEGLGYLDRLIDEGWYCSARLYRMARRELEEVTFHRDR